jgi:hypothetical protein
MTAIVRQVVDASIGVAPHIQPNYSRAEHALQMMRDETITTTDVQNIRPTLRRRLIRLKRRLMVVVRLVTVRDECKRDASTKC